MSRYSVIKKEFAFLKSKYAFKKHMKQKHGAYYYLSWTKGRKEIIVWYDDRIDERIESPVWIQIFDADSPGTVCDPDDEFRNEFAIQSGSPKERIRCAAKWLREAIENKTVLI